jgi:hypothetical protein
MRRRHPAHQGRCRQHSLRHQQPARGSTPGLRARRFRRGDPRARRFIPNRFVNSIHFLTNSAVLFAWIARKYILIWEWRHRPYRSRTKFDITTAVIPFDQVLLKFFARPDRMRHALVSTGIKGMGDDRRHCQAGWCSVEISKFLNRVCGCDFIFINVNRCFKIGEVKKSLINSY